MLSMPKDFCYHFLDQLTFGKLVFALNRLPWFDATQAEIRTRASRTKKSIWSSIKIFGLSIVNLTLRWSAKLLPAKDSRPLLAQDIFYFRHVGRKIDQNWIDYQQYCRRRQHQRHVVKLHHCCCHRRRHRRRRYWVRRGTNWFCWTRNGANKNWRKIGVDLNHKMFNRKWQQLRL